MNIINYNYDSIRMKLKEEFCSARNLKKLNCVENITEENIKFLINLYDRRFLNNYILRNINSKINVSLSNRMTSSGGKTIFTRSSKEKRYEIRVSRKVLESFKEEKIGRKVCGIDSKDMIEGLMLILEHEICHVIEFDKYGTSNCKGKRFKAIANEVFGHTSSYHEILVQQREKETSNVKTGQQVVFIYKNESIEGIVSRINKRATVMVKDRTGNYRDKEGVTYSKWYVPLKNLKLRR